MTKPSDEDQRIEIIGKTSERDYPKIRDRFVDPRFELEAWSASLRKQNYPHVSQDTDV